MYALACPECMESEVATARALDMELAARAQAGDRAAFGDLVARHTRRGLAIAYRVLQNRQDAEDALQDAFIATLASIASYDVTRPFGPWFGQVVVSKALNTLNKRRLRADQPLTHDVADNGGTPHEHTARLQTTQRVRAALHSLSPRQRLVVELVDLEGFSAVETAQLLGISAATARWHLHEARGTLRQTLAQFHQAQR
jgi:RNA polymerase sigma factor (sigma-70 family)